MNIKRTLAFALVGAMATTGCVSVEGTRAKLTSKDTSEVKKGEDTIYQIATTGKDSTGFVHFTTQERVEYVKLTSNNDLLLRIIDDTNDGGVIAAATERLDFSKKGLASEFVQQRFGQINFWVKDDAKDLLKKQIIAKLTQEDLLNLIENKVNEGRARNSMQRGRRDPDMGLDFEDRDLLVDRLIEITASPEVLWKIAQREIYADNHHQDAAKRKLLTMLDKITDTKMIETILEEGRRSIKLNTNQQLVLMKKLPEDKMVELVISGIKRHLKSDWDGGDLAVLETGIGVMSSIKETKSIVKIIEAILERIAEYRETCERSWLMNWDASDKKKVQDLLRQLPKLSDDTLTALICCDGTNWKYFMHFVSADVAYKILTLGKAKSAEQEEALVKKLPADKVDMKVYNGVKTDVGKKAVLAAMPAEMKKNAQEFAAKAFNSVLEKAKVAAKETFELNGFYLGMDFDDMKQVLSHHFPDFTIKEARDGDAKDADYVVYVPKQSTPFCYASAKDKKVYQFNFGKVILKKWYKYDVQTYMEWAHAYERETKIDMKFKIVEKDTTVYEPMNMSRSYHVWFHQESYQYKHNTKGYRLTYFGEEKDFTFEGGIGGALIKEMAAPRFRYVRGDPGSLRATVEND